jgi:hypothetical protein
MIMKNWRKNLKTDKFSWLRNELEKIILPDDELKDALISRGVLPMTCMKMYLMARLLKVRGVEEL